MKPSMRRKILIALFSITVVALFILIYFVPTVSDTFTPTMLAQYDKVVITDDIEGYIVRDEAVYFAMRAGIVENLVPEGEKVRRKEKIIRITSYSVEEHEEMTEIRKKIDMFTTGSNIFAGDVKKLDTIINNTQEQLKSAKKRNNQEEQRDLEDKLTRLTAKRVNIAGPESSLTTAEQEQAASGSQTTQKKNAEDPIDMPGFVSYYIDGYETEFTPENMYILNKQKVSEQEFKSLNTYQMAMRKQDPVFKLVKSSTWYVITWPDEEDVVKYKKGNTVRLEIADREVSGRVDDIIETDGDVLVMMKFSTYFPGVSQQRKIATKVVTLDSEGLRIGNKSLTTEEDVVGVYVKNLDGKFVFKPVKIMKTDGEYALVYSGFFEETTTDGGIQRIYTINAYDEVLKNGGGGKK